MMERDKGSIDDRVSMQALKDLQIYLSDAGPITMRFELRENDMKRRKGVRYAWRISWSVQPSIAEIKSCQRTSLANFFTSGLVMSLMVSFGISLDRKCRHGSMKQCKC